MNKITGIVSLVMLIAAVTLVSMDRMVIGIVLLTLSMVITASQLVGRLNSKPLKISIVGVQIIIVGALLWILINPNISA
ncbi:hypothetical protein [Halobacillus sp. B23F22_1]|uniref:hypothetical protein n=1 Tax=Halobacillus sp. B23F22_1 TaxID=3459514 RepID=UPI00373F9D60